MKNSMYKFMKIGLVHCMAYPKTMKGEGPILETLQKIAADDFFTAVEISGIKDNKIRNIVKKLLKISYLTIVYGAHPRQLINKLDLNSFNEAERKRAVKELKLEIDQAYEIRAKEFIFFSGKDPGKKYREQAHKLLVSSIKELCNYAKCKGKLILVLESFDREIEKKCLIGPANEARIVAENIRKEFDNFGLLVDLSHIPLLNESPAQAILPIKDYLIHAHIGNCILSDKKHPSYGDQHPWFGIERGRNNVEELTEFLKLLLDIGFLNIKNPPIVSFEIKPQSDDESPEVVIANAKRVLREAWLKTIETT